MGHSGEIGIIHSEVRHSCLKLRQHVKMVDKEPDKLEAPHPKFKFLQV